MIPKSKLFAWELTRNMLLTRNKLNHIATDIDGECPFYNKEEENINRIFQTCDILSNIWSAINYIVLTLIICIFILEWLDILGFIGIGIIKSFYICRYNMG